MCPEAFTTAGCLFGLAFVDLTGCFIAGCGFFGGNFESGDGLG
jgi:hypothetical protein